MLAERIRASGHRQVMLLDRPEDLAMILAPIVQPKDMVICLGAGDITKWAAALPGQLEKVL